MVVHKCELSSYLYLHFPVILFRTGFPTKIFKSISLEKKKFLSKSAEVRADDKKGHLEAETMVPMTLT
jgi:hypothetical protein